MNSDELAAVRLGKFAHDLNNVLAAIMSYTELARYEVPEQPAVLEHLDGVLRASQRALVIVRQMQESGRRPTTPAQGIPALPPTADRAVLLVVESKFRDLALAALKSSGHPVCSCMDLNEAMAVLRAGPEGFSLLLADSKLLDAADEDVRRTLHELAPHFPILLRGPTNDAGEDSVTNLRGTITLLPELVDAETLLATVAAILSHSGKDTEGGRA